MGNMFALTTSRKTLTMKLSEYMNEIRESTGNDDLKDIGDQYFIEARRPDDEGEKAIEEAQMVIHLTDKAGGSATATVLPSQVFYARCLAQITDYCLPTEGDDGIIVDATRDPKNKGDNRANREVYAALYRSPLRSIVSAWLVEVSGVKQDVEDLGNALGR